MFQFYDPVSSILGNEDLLGKTVAPARRDVTCPGVAVAGVTAPRCCEGGRKIVHCDFSKPNLAVKPEYAAAVMEKEV